MQKISADRLDYYSTGVFAKFNEIVIKRQQEGKPVYNLSVGTPDFPTEQYILDAISEAAKDPANYKYTLRDYPDMIEAFIAYYKRRFGVELEEDEVISVYGTQEGMGHLGLALADPGDVILIPNPGYPIFEAGMYLSGAELYFYPLLEENNFLPDFDKIPEDIAKRAKILVLSYPYNPVCTAADDSVYEKAIEFAKKYDILIIHDNAYSDIIFDGREGGSFLQYEGAKEIGAEFYSLSKSFNVTGCRISFLVGNKEIIKAMRLLKSQYDFGMFRPLQIGAIAALNGPTDGVEARKKEYELRRNALCDGLTNIGWPVKRSEGTMFVWAKIPPKYKTTEEFVFELIEKAGVVCTPGDSFGSLGEGYVRFALVKPVDEMKEIVDVIDKSGVLK